MNIGSFTVDGKTINVQPDYSHIDGRIYRLVRADTETQVAVTTYRGLDVTVGAPFDKASLQDGLRGVLGRYART